jgi:hypothetical protein
VRCLDRFEGELAVIEARIVRHAPSAVIAYARRGRIVTDEPQTLQALLDARAEVLRVLPEVGATVAVTSP